MAKYRRTTRRSRPKGTPKGRSRSKGQSRSKGRKQRRRRSRQRYSRQTKKSQKRYSQKRYSQKKKRYSQQRGGAAGAPLIFYPGQIELEKELGAWRPPVNTWRWGQTNTVKGKFLARKDYRYWSDWVDHEELLKNTERDVRFAFKITLQHSRNLAIYRFTNMGDARSWLEANWNAIHASEVTRRLAPEPKEETAPEPEPEHEPEPEPEHEPEPEMAPGHELAREPAPKGSGIGVVRQISAHKLKVDPGLNPHPITIRLDNIQVDGRILHKLSSHKPVEIEAGITFQVGDYLAEGHYGAVHKVKVIVDGVGPTIYALKLLKDLPGEIRIDVSACVARNVIQYKYLGKFQFNHIHYHGILMPYASGGDLFNKNHSGKIFTIALQILDGLQCMIDNNYLYTDMKASNCLEFAEDGKGKYVIADIDGFFKFGEENAVATYPPPETMDGRSPGIFTVPTDPTVVCQLAVWFMGILLSGLAGVDISGLTHNQITQTLEMVTGRHPKVGDTHVFYSDGEIPSVRYPTSVLKVNPVVTRARASASASAGRVAPEVVEVIAACLQTDNNTRMSLEVLKVKLTEGAALEAQAPPKRALQLRRASHAQASPKRATSL